MERQGEGRTGMADWYGESPIRPVDPPAAMGAFDSTHATQCVRS